MAHCSNSNRFINLAQTANNTEALDKLAQACDAARFGRGAETVLDETYRKAGKMDAERFMTRLDVEANGLLMAVNLGLLPGKDEELSIRAELYKLNVYGEHPHIYWSQSPTYLGRSGEGAFVTAN